MKKFTFLLTLFCFLSAVVIAEEKTSTPPSVPSTTKTATKTPEKPLEKVLFFMPDGSPVDNTISITAKLSDVINQDYRMTGINADKVLIKGLMTLKGDSIQGKEFSINWTGAERNDITKASIFEKPLVTNLRSPEGKIPPNTLIPAYGDIENMSEAIRKLFEEEEEKEEKEEKKTAHASKNAPTTASPASSNEYAEKYQSMPAESKPDPVTTYGTTKEGCSVRVDWDKGMVFPQTRTTTTTDGVTTQGECKDGELPFPIKWSFTDCMSDEVKLEELKAYAMRKPFYVTSEGEISYLGECEVSPEDVFEIQESSQGCSVQVVHSENIAKEQTALFYTNRNNAVVTVSPCQAREGGNTYPVQETFDGCSYRPDFDNMIAYQQARKTYEKDGVTIAVTPCTDSTVTYPIELDYGNCQIQTNKETGVATRFAMLKTMTGDGVKYLTACQPTDTTDYFETVEGCESIHTDYFEAGYSRGASRWWYDFGSGKTYATECQENTTSYPHKLEQTGWQYNDAELEADRLMQKYIELPAPAGKTIVQVASVLESAPAEPYVYDRNAVVGINVFDDEGCNRREHQEQRDIYKRPDNTEYTASGVPTSPSNWIDVCTVENQNKTYHQARINSYSHQNTGCSAPNGSHNNCAFLYREGYPGTKGYCSSNASVTGQVLTGEPNNMFFKGKAWEAKRYFATRQKKTNPYTSQEFYTSWQTTNTTNDCPASINICPSTKSVFDSLSDTSDFFSNYTFQTDWANCSDY